MSIEHEIHVHIIIYTTISSEFNFEHFHYCTGICAMEFENFWTALHKLDHFIYYILVYTYLSCAFMSSTIAY